MIGWSDERAPVPISGSGASGGQRVEFRQHLLNQQSGRLQVVEGSQIDDDVAQARLDQQSEGGDGVTRRAEHPWRESRDEAVRG